MKLKLDRIVGLTYAAGMYGGWLGAQKCILFYTHDLNLIEL